MTLQEIQERWKPGMRNSEAAVEWWDSKAEDFAAKEFPTVKNSMTMRLICDKHMVGPGKTALDVGCGGGRFTFGMEQLGAVVTGTDFSPRMIRECEKAKAAFSSSADFCVQDWQNMDLQRLGWKHRFDLVLANMTPAVISADSFLKLSEASRDWCLMVKPSRRRNEVLDRLTDLLELEADTKSLDETLMYAFELLWLKGLNPGIEYEDQVWENSWPVEAAVREYTLRLSASHTLDQQQKKKIEDFLHDISVDKTVRETTHTTIAAIYWQI